MFNLTHSNVSGYSDSMFPSQPFKLVEVVFIVLVAGSLSLITITGNILVMLSIKVNRKLQTINNYFLFSLACADFIIGLCSMNLYTAYIVMGYWPMGPLVCDLWLALDYVASNASVMNLLIISFDRYFCVTQPLSYPIKRTTKMAGMMIAVAWIVSFILWAPAILFWQFLVGVRTVPEGECYIQFFSNAIVTFSTAIAAFYLPVTIMTVLYWRISKASKCRVKVEKRTTSGAPLTALFSNQVHSQKNKDNNSSQNSEKPKAIRPQSRGKCNIWDSRLHIDKFPTEMNRKGSGYIEDEGFDSCAPCETKESSNDSTSVSNIDPKDVEGTLLRRAFNSKSSHSVSCSFVVANSDPSSHKADTGRVSSTNEEVTSELDHIEKKTKRSPRKRNSAPSREKRVTQTIMAILVAFVVTWTPYNVMVLINIFYSNYIPNAVWIIGYWLCYVNSTVNPACYALCNVTFKKTFRDLLFCRYKNIRIHK